MWSEAKPSPEGLWQRFLQAIEPVLSAHVIANWLRPVRCAGLEGDVVTLEVRDEFCRNWLSDHYLEFVRDHLEKILHQPLAVRLVVNDALARGPGGAANGDADPAMPAANAWPEGAGHVNAVEPGETTVAQAARKSGTGKAPAAQAAEAPARTADKRRSTPSPAAGDRVPSAKGRRSKGSASRPADQGPPLPTRALNVRYTFERFVEGPSNELASAASRAVAEKPGLSYNPLFLVGGVGLGKTHLLSAIGHAVAKQDARARVHYTSSEQFASEVIAAVRAGRLEQLRKQYRDQIDVLLMDDIQLMAGKERTQHEFFQLFNTLYDSHRQIVVTSDKLPHEIPDIQERLSSRFQWGLIADVQPPEVETRIAILRKKAELERLTLPNDVAFFLARAIRSNVRELEGALVRITAQANLTQSPLTVDYVRTSLSDILQHRLSDLSIDSIQRTVAQFYAIRLSDLRGINRKKEVVRARQVAMFLCRKHLASSFPEIGARFGKKDHTTAMSACQRIHSGQVSDAPLREQLVELEHRLEHVVPN